VGVGDATPEDDFFHSELRLRHIGRRRRDVVGVEKDEVFDASAMDGDRAGGVRRRSERCRLTASLTHVSEQSVT